MVPVRVPDGLWVDDEGCLWVAMWAAGSAAVRADGALLHAWPRGVPADRLLLRRPGRATLIVTSPGRLPAEVLAAERPPAGHGHRRRGQRTAAAPYRPLAGVLPS